MADAPLERSDDTDAEVAHGVLRALGGVLDPEIRNLLEELDDKGRDQGSTSSWRTTRDSS